MHRANCPNIHSRFPLIQTNEDKECYPGRNTKATMNFLYLGNNNALFIGFHAELIE